MRRRSRVKRLVFALLPALVLFSLAELLLRLVLVLVPQWDVVVAGVSYVTEDRELFWRLKPELDTAFANGAKLRTNRLGLRDGEIGEKAPGEYRVLSLGESTTFGDSVEAEETYSRVAERSLRERKLSRPIRVINAAVPAYTSFQSLRYLKKDGLALAPDVVVLYHEGNDYLPCGWGDVAGKSETDPECYERRQRWSWSWSLGHLRIVRVPAYWIARFTSRGLDVQTFQAAWGHFGRRVPGIKTRLTQQQQWEVLEGFRNLCREHRVQLLFIHPTYRATGRHRCPLTEFARENAVPILETFDLFEQRGGRPIPESFIDEAHPTPESHRRIGEALAEFLTRQPWFPKSVE